MSESVDGVLFLHNSSAGAITESHREGVEALARHSGFPVASVNIALGYPERLADYRFAAIFLHYSMFWADLAPIGDRLREYLTGSDALKIAQFQDEQSALAERRAFCAEAGVDIIYTCLQSPHAEAVYGETGASRIISHLPGYVGEGLLVRAAELARPGRQRPIDIGYRARPPLPGWRGAAVEKYEIGVEFKRRVSGRGLVLDIETDEAKRIYGKAWLRFVADCKAVLGTESATTIIDPDDGHEIPYRTIGPRHFEAAALATAQIMFAGEYSGAIEAGTHYIPLEKDYSNLDEALARFADEAERERVVRAAHGELIASGRYSYATFVAGVDEQLAEAGLEPGKRSPARDVVPRLYGPRRVYAGRLLRHRARGLRHRASRLLAG